MRLTPCVAAFTAIVSLGIGSSAFSQGALNPAGPPEASMRTLEQIESRIPVNTLEGDMDSVHVITSSGSYYLTGNINGEAMKNGIKIMASHVTLDLNGYVLMGVQDSLDGVKVDSGFEYVSVSNGSATGWGQDGFDLEDFALAEKLRVSGHSNSGIRAGNYSRVFDSITNGGTYGVNVGGQSIVQGCIATGSVVGINGISSSLIQCVASENTGTGLALDGPGGLVMQCQANSNEVNGFGDNAGGGRLIKDNAFTYNKLYGINILANSLVQNNSFDSNGENEANGAAVNCRIGRIHVDANVIANSMTGVRFSTNDDNVVSRNYFYDVGSVTSNVSGNDVGLIGTAAGATRPYANVQH